MCTFTFFSTFIIITIFYFRLQNVIGYCAKANLNLIKIFLLQLNLKRSRSGPGPICVQSKCVQNAARHLRRSIAYKGLDVCNELERHFMGGCICQLPFNSCPPHVSRSYLGALYREGTNITNLFHKTFSAFPAGPA